VLVIIISGLFGEEEAWEITITIKRGIFLNLNL